MTDEEINSSIEAISDYCPAGVSDIEIVEYYNLGVGMPELEGVFGGMSKRVAFIGQHLKECEQCMNVYKRAEQRDMLYGMDSTAKNRADFWDYLW